MQEEWIGLKPFPNIKFNHYIADLIGDEQDGLEIQLSGYHDEGKKVRVFFANPVLAHRSVYETFRHQLLVNLRACYGDEFLDSYSLFKVENSLYLQSLSCSHSGTITHFCIISLEAIIDIVSTTEPIIETCEN